jgi:hypothetical protein
MRLARTITALAVISAALIALALPATAASASTPVLYGRGNGWHDPARRPAHFFTGHANGAFMQSLHWDYWTSGHAYATGRLEAQNPGCTRPSFECPYHGRWVSIFLRDVQVHGGRAYFRKATVHFYRRGTKRRERLTFATRPPASIPVWHGPDEFPWF